VRSVGRWLHTPAAALVLLCSLFLIVPMTARYVLGWSHPFGYLSDLAIGGLLIVLVHQRHALLSVALAVLWCLCTLGTTELVVAVGRMPEPGDLQYLIDPQFVSHSTQEGGLSQPWLVVAVAAVLALYLAVRAVQRGVAMRPLSWAWLLAPSALLGVHALYQYQSPSAAEQWQQFNLPHKLLAEGLSGGQMHLRDWLLGNSPNQAPDISAFTTLDLNGASLLADTGQARNLLIITLEGVTGAYIAAARSAIGSPNSDTSMPRLSQWAERGMLTPDYVLHGHQTIRGLYAMLCGDYNKLNSGTPKGVELLNNSLRANQCLPAQLRENGFTTHFLQGAGLRFMAKDTIMPRMGFDSTQGRDWFPNTPYLDFSWGMDDKAFFEGAAVYVEQLREQQQPWMLTLLTVGTHQPYSAPEDYLARYPNAKQAAVGYLDDALGDFLDTLERQGVLKDTLVVVTSDESHGLENVRLASAWGFNLLLAPEQAQLPAIKEGVYGHIDLTASMLDYFALPHPDAIGGRSLLRNYDSGRAMMSYTNGLLRQHDGQGIFTECDFQQVCRRYASAGFISPHARYLDRVTGRDARLVSQRAALLDQSLLDNLAGQHFQFASSERILLQEKPGDDWADNLVGAQYLELAKGTRTTVTLQVRAVQLDSAGAHLELKTKEYDREVLLPLPELPPLSAGETLSVSFDFDNIDTRKAFSFHLLGQGSGLIEITDFSVSSVPLDAEMLASQHDAVEASVQ